MLLTCRICDNDVFLIVQQGYKTQKDCCITKDPGWGPETHSHLAAPTALMTLC